MSPREILLLSLVFHIGLESVLGNAPFRSRKSPSEIISTYAVVDPAITYSRTLVKGHHKSLRVVLQGDDENFVINLELNELLLPPHFCSTYTSKTGELIREEYPNCFYQGRVEGHPKWRATFSTCFGLRGSFGDHDSSNRHFHLEPLHSNASSVRLEGPHAFYLDTEHKNNKPGTCGTDPSHTIGGNGTHDHQGVNFQLLEGKRPKRQLPSTLIVEWLVVNDFAQYNSYGQDISAVVQRAIELANEVDMLYENLPLSASVKISLVESITWTTGNQLDTASTNANSMLESFRRYHQSEINQDPNSVPHDSAMLITGSNLDGSTIGIAFTGTMCNTFSGVGVTQDGGASAAFVGSTAAHEMGHIFDMGHDDNCCTVPSNQGGCVMNAAASAFNTASAWSTCSANELAAGVNSQGLGVCLDNNPTQIVGDPSCGNGILEPGEICDCGSPDECNDPCCDAPTCTLASGAQCGSGPCCDEQCQFRAYGTTCRSPVDNDCDVLEYCTGDSAECPENAFHTDGTPCDGGDAYCFSGSCVTRDDQCMAYYGSTSSGSVDQCYTTFNTRGDFSGHCGSTGSQYIPCSEANALCGLIMCQGGPSQPTVFLSITYSVAGNGLCKTFTTPADSDEASPSLVKDGTECGSGQICLSQECVPLSSLPTVTCPTGSNGRTCSGNGVCNSRSQCSCNIGFTGTSCEIDLNAPATTPPTGTEARTTGTPDSGASPDSSASPPDSSASPPSNSTDSPTSDEDPTPAAAFAETTGLVIGVVVGILLVVIAVVAAVLVFLYRKFKTKKKTLHSKSAAHLKKKNTSKAAFVSSSREDLLKNDFSLPARGAPPPPPSSRGYSPPQPSRGYSPPRPTRGYSPPRPTRGYSPPRPTRGYSPPRPTRGYSPPRPTRGYSPPRPTRGYSPPRPTRGYSPPQPARGHSPPAPTRGLSPQPPSKRLSPSSLQTTTTFTVNQEVRRSPPAPPMGKKAPVPVSAPAPPISPTAPLTSFFPPQLPSRLPVMPTATAAPESHEPTQPATRAPPPVLPVVAKKPPPAVSGKPFAPLKPVPPIMPVTPMKPPNFKPTPPPTQAKPAVHQPAPVQFQPVMPPPQTGPETAPKPVKAKTHWPLPPSSAGESGAGSRGPPPPPKKPMLPPRMM